MMLGSEEEEEEEEEEGHAYLPKEYTNRSVDDIPSELDQGSAMKSRAI